MCINLQIKQILIVFVSIKICYSQAFINYSVDNQGVELLKFFHDIKNGFYVDIGAYDSIFASNTLNLQVAGWDGINIDASPKRLPTFFTMRPWQNSINLAIGDQDKFVTLYELTEDSSSTISQKVRDYVADYKQVVESVKIASISMKQLCERYFYRRPLFLNLDIQGYGSKALQSNDWSNPKCVPDIIFSQINQQTKISGLPLPQQILFKNGYLRWKNYVGLNQIFIRKSQYTKYEQKYAQGQMIMKSKIIFNINSISNYLALQLHTTTNTVPHYSPQNDNLYYYFTKQDQILDVQKIIKHNKQVCARQYNRPILILNFNPQVNYIMMRNKNYSMNTFIITQMYFWNFTIFDQDYNSNSIYIFNHYSQLILAPRIAFTQMQQSQVNYLQIVHQTSIDEAIQHGSGISNQSVQVLKYVQQLLSQSIALMNKSNINMQARMRELVNTMLTNHHYDKAQLEKVLTSIQNLNNAYNTYHELQAMQQYSKQFQSIQQEMVKINIIQAGIALAIFFCFLILNIILCVAWPTKIDKYRLSANSTKLSEDSHRYASQGQFNQNNLRQNQTLQQSQHPNQIQK